MQTKSKFPKLLLFFFLIPYLAVLLFTALDCLINYAYIEWLWVTEWMILIPETIGYYLLCAMLYALFGVMAYKIFFGKRYEKWILAILVPLCSFLFPFLRYIVRHFGYGSLLTNVEMLEIYNDDVTVGVTMLAYALIALLVILVERAYYAWILREPPKKEGKIYSPKHPIGITMLIYFAAMFLFSVLTFIFAGEISAEAILSLTVELVIDASGFWIAVFAAYTLRKWELVQKENDLPNGEIEHL